VRQGEGGQNSAYDPLRRVFFFELRISVLRLMAMLVFYRAMSRTTLSYGAVSILHAVAAGSRFGFDIMAATGLTSGTVYPTLDRLEQNGLLTSRWEEASAAHAEGRPARRYFTLTAKGASGLKDALARYKTLRPIEIDPRSLAPEHGNS
jgi:PadR family transcriptional regulator, regulatory protein PadR